jgi:hypothetical protein
MVRVVMSFNEPGFATKQVLKPRTERNQLPRDVMVVLAGASPTASLRHHTLDPVQHVGHV